MNRLHLKIYGKVQGVFFRAHVYEKAAGLNLLGYVQNDSDGTVEVVAEGDAEKLKALERWCKTGSDYSRVEKIEEKWEDIDKHDFDSFTIKY